MALTKKKLTKKPKKLKKPLRKKPVKKRAIRRAVKKTSAKKKMAAKKPQENIIGLITHYFPKVQAAVVKLKAPLVLGDTIRVKGHTTNFTQQVTSMQIDHVSLDMAKKGQEIGLLVNSRVRQHDIVCKV
jgi:putative protease